MDVFPALKRKNQNETFTEFIYLAKRLSSYGCVLQVKSGFRLKFKLVINFQPR